MINLLKNKKYLKFISIIAYFTIIFFIITKGIINSIEIHNSLIEIIFQIFISIITIAILFFLPIYLGLCKSSDTKTKKDCLTEKKNNSIIVKYKNIKVEVPLNITKEELRRKYNFENINRTKIKYSDQLYLRSYLLKFYDELFLEKIIGELEAFELYGILPATEEERNEFLNERKTELITSIVGISAIYLIFVIPALIFFLIITIKVINIKEIIILNYNINIIAIGILLLIVTSIPFIILQLNYFTENKVFSKNKLYKTNVTVADIDFKVLKKKETNDSTVKFYKIRIKDEQDNILNKWFNIKEVDYINDEKNYILYLCQDKNRINTTIMLNKQSE